MCNYVANVNVKNVYKNGFNAHLTMECVDMINSGCPLAEFLNNLLFV